MKKIVFWSIASLGLILYLISSFSNPDAKIGQSFQQACQEVIAAQEIESSSYASAFKLYNNAVAKLDNITNKYSSSEIALNLFKNQQKVGPYPFLEFKEEIIPRAKLRAEAESNPLDCSYYAVNLLDTVQFEDKLKIMKAAKLAEISIRYSKKWQFKKAASVLAEAKSIVQTIYSDSFKVSAYAELAQILGVSGGNKKEALELLFQALTVVSNMVPHEQPQVLQKIISAYCGIDELESTLEILSQFESADLDETWSIISQHYAAKENLKSALKTAENIHDDNILDETFRVIINQYAASGRFEKAKTLADKINPQNIATKIKSLADIGFHAVQEGQRDLAVTFFEQAIQTANLFESFQLPQKLSVLNYVALRFIELRDYPNARQLLESNCASAIKMPEFNRAEAFAEIATAYGKMGEFEKALQLVNKYIPKYITIDVHGATLSRLALQYASEGEYQKAAELAEQIDDQTTLLEEDRDSVLSQIAILSAATKNFPTALEIAKKIDSSFYRPLTYSEIALVIPNNRLPFPRKPKVKQYLHQIITELDAPIKTSANLQNFN